MSGDGDSSEVPANDSPQSGGGGVSLFTQDQVNAIAANTKRSAVEGYFKDLGLPIPKSGDDLKAAFEAAEAHRKLQEGEKGDVERLTGELASVQTEAAKVPDLEKTMTRQRIAADLGLKSKYWKYIEGETDEEITDSVKGVLGDLGLGGDESGEEPGQQEQVRRPPRPNQQQGTGGGQSPAKTLEAGAAAYAERHKQKE